MMGSHFGVTIVLEDVRAQLTKVHVQHSIFNASLNPISC